MKKEKEKQMMMESGVPIDTPLSKLDYSLTGVLDFLQRSWIQFELDRAKWISAQAELSV